MRGYVVVARAAAVLVGLAAGTMASAVVEEASGRDDERHQVKIHPRIIERISGADDEAERIEVAVSVRAGADLGGILENALRRPFVNPAGLQMIIGEVRPGDIEKLARLDAVLEIRPVAGAIEPPPPPDPDLPGPGRERPDRAKTVSTKDWYEATDVHRARLAWDNGYTGQGVRVMVAVDLAEIVPESVNAHGIEVFLANRDGGAFDWWASYACTSIEDEIDGVDTPRFLNQPHALTASATWRPGPKWSLTGVFHYHTGWAATSVSARPVERPDGIWVLDCDVGPFYQETWDDYYRFDLRASRTTKIGHRGRLTFFIDIQNLTNRGNVRGIAIADPEFEYTEAEGWVATFPEEDWLPIIPSYGVSYEF